ncbi:alanine/glycine:cation symporter family protein [Lipingzhangella sp. LS1_29]|uniref:Alanine/glycine:cation symporter family protein n=2 Tax=Lipingzhangella rawalii TaxID=2055835 RepID=A0ABU2H690_9ACTN|nr:alanine/glycine:cation symporter family protein [Lipingzhangella rawalii]MDS1270818.1 alanine/glycine:cation symporter family protein [Lipingzhangella rawalii]
MYLLIPLITLLSVYFTIRLGVVQLRLVPEMFRTLFSQPETAPDGKKAISSFQAFSVSAAARIGTGNIVGVAGAIAIGGPGAVLWMWLMGLLVGAASFVESTLGQLYKVRDSTGYRGGPAYYLERGLRARWAGIIFAVTIVLTFAFVFSAVQTNTITGALSSSMEQATGAEAPLWLAPTVGVVLVTLAAVVIFGGVRRIAHVTQALVPLMALIYIVLGLVVMALYIDEVPAVFGLIVESAFGLREVAGATLGTVIVQGVRRGMFSNEAGLGSAPNAGASASVSHPVKQGLVQTLGVYFDTLVVCSVTAFVILLSNPTYGEERGPVMTQEALQTALGPWALHLLTVILLLVAFSSVLGNYFYGQANMLFITPRSSVLFGFQLVFLCALFLGSVVDVQIVWSLADTTMGVMALVNLLGIAPLAWMVALLLRDYQDQRRQGIDPVFTRDRLPQLRGEIECWEPASQQVRD